MAGLFFRLVFCLACLCAAQAAADLLDTAPPFDIIGDVTYPAGDSSISVARTQQGFVVVWEQYATAEGPAEIVAQRLDVGGALIGDYFAISDSQEEYAASSSQVQPYGAGGFIVAWAGTDTDRDWVRARRYDSAAAPSDDVFTVHESTMGSIRSARVAAAGNGNFLVFWREHTQAGGDIRGRLYDPAAQPIADDIRPAGAASAYHGDVAVSGATDGSFVVAWRSGFTYETDEAGGYYPYTAYRGYARRVEADGTMPTARLGGFGQYSLDVAHIERDEFVVAWSDSYRSYDVPPEPLDAFVSIRNADGEELHELNVNLRALHSDFDEHGPHVALAPADAGGFVVAWSRSDAYLDQPSSGINAFVRSSTAAGELVGLAVPLRWNLPTNRPFDLDVAANGDKVLLAWHSGTAIAGQLLDIVDSVDCGDATRDGNVTANDALMTLAAALGGRYCSYLICDADGDEDIDTSDALRVLVSAVGGVSPLACKIY